MKYEKEKLVEEFYRLIWSSLESHLKYTHSHSSEGRDFHKKTTKEYARMMYILSKLS